MDELFEEEKERSQYIANKFKYPPKNESEYKDYIRYLIGLIMELKDKQRSFEKELSSLKRNKDKDLFSGRDQRDETKELSNKIDFLQKQITYYSSFIESIRTKNANNTYCYIPNNDNGTGSGFNDCCYPVCSTDNYEKVYYSDQEARSSGSFLEACMQFLWKKVRVKMKGQEIQGILAKVENDHIFVVSNNNVNIFQLQSIIGIEYRGA